MFPYQSKTQRPFRGYCPLPVQFCCMFWLFGLNETPEFNIFNIQPKVALFGENRLLWGEMLNMLNSGGGLLNQNVLIIAEMLNMLNFLGRARRQGGGGPQALPKTFNISHIFNIFNISSERSTVLFNRPPRIEHIQHLPWNKHFWRQSPLALERDNFFHKKMLFSICFLLPPQASLIRLRWGGGCGLWEVSLIAESTEKGGGGG